MKKILILTTILLLVLGYSKTAETKTKIFEVVGESFNNKDGKNRQDIIKNFVQVLEPAYLKFYKYKGSLACGVYVDKAFKKQVGNIGRNDVQKVHRLSKSGAIIKTRFYEKKGGMRGYMFGVTIEIFVQK